MGLLPKEIVRAEVHSSQERRWVCSEFTFNREKFVDLPLVI
jgi:hypothetical protein